MLIHRIFVVSVILLCGGVLAACGSDETESVERKPSPPPPTSVSTTRQITITPVGDEREQAERAAERRRVRARLLRERRAREARRRARERKRRVAARARREAAKRQRQQPSQQEAPTPQASQPASGCDPNYSPCVPPYPPDLDCPDIGHPVQVVGGSDPHGLDRDGDGVGCESQ